MEINETKKDESKVTWSVMRTEFRKFTCQEVKDISLQPPELRSCHVTSRESRLRRKRGKGSGGGGIETRGTLWALVGRVGLPLVTAALLNPTLSTVHAPGSGS